MAHARHRQILLNQSDNKFQIVQRSLPAQQADRGSPAFGEAARSPEDTPNFPNQ